MKTGYFLSIVLALQCTMPMHGMSRACYQAITRSKLLPTLTKHTSLFPKSFCATTPTKNISLPSYRLFQQTLRPQNFSRTSLIAATGLSLWGYNTLSSMTVHAQEEQLQCSKEMVDLSHKFEVNFLRNNLIEAQRLLFDMANNLKNDDDYKILKQQTNQFLSQAEPIFIAGIPQEKPEGIKLHICRILMANGMLKLIIETEEILIPKPYTNFFLAIKENHSIKEMYLNTIRQLESDVISDNTKHIPTVHNEMLLKLYGMIKAILNSEDQ